MSEIVLKVENVWKQYRLGLTGTGTLRDDVARTWARLRGKEDPTLRIGVANDHQSTEGTYVWALQDLNFEVRQGEVLGIIGKNGAGKSTLLKILSKVTAPTRGHIKVKGRVASLLEVGTGFHPELTGRENIYLNGAILGMRKREVKAKLDEIIDFAGVAKYIDTPVKRYSSGMYVRLAFAVAAHLDPEILIVDEVLAVGDAEFQKKALGKMQDVSKGEGRTVLFVSHSMAAVENLCSRVLVMQQGTLSFSGNSTAAISQYISSTSFEASSRLFQNDSLRAGSGDVKVVAIEFRNENNEPVEAIPAGAALQVVLRFVNYHPEKKYKIVPSISIKSFTDQGVALHHSRLIGKTYQDLPTQGEFKLIIPKLPLVPNTYTLSYSIMDDGQLVDTFDASLRVNVQESNFYGHGEIVPASHGLVLLEGDWHIN
ncbi:ABC transporter ATP-binding protein [Eisenibacter elegans]|uniref:ABC transporter ATP-binding protein n=1 Tax=Eisenibacter elegans TaxID=997 RepID=UPI00042353BD|nr:ABC transporter ATP-binding protein [Eisenibacter elegans]